MYVYVCLSVVCTRQARTVDKGREAVLVLAEHAVVPARGSDNGVIARTLRAPSSISYTQTQ